MTVRIFVTGGTFDKEYNEIDGTLYFKDTHVKELLDLGRCKINAAIRTLMMIDSLDMTDSDRDLIREHCKTCPESKIIITHGTDTMVDTARVLGQSMIPGKTIVLTGALIPYKFGSSDGLFNLGGAIAFVQSLSPGVYIAMNGSYFSWNNVRKNREQGLFEQING
jgi:L-asparaginase